MAGLLLRFAAALALVLLTWNPSFWNFSEWAAANLTTNLPVVALVGVIFLILYIVFLTATFRSIGVLGVVLVVALAGAIDWVLIDYGIIASGNPTALTWVGLITIALVMGVGMSWAIIWRRISGQLEVDDNDGA
jgi:hypothetical protein